MIAEITLEAGKYLVLSETEGKIEIHSQHHSDLLAVAACIGSKQDTMMVEMVGFVPERKDDSAYLDRFGREDAPSGERYDSSTKG